MGEVGFVSVLLENKALFPAKFLSVNMMNKMRENNLPEEKVFVFVFVFVFFLLLFFFKFPFRTSRSLSLRK